MCQVSSFAIVAGSAAVIAAIGATSWSSMAIEPKLVQCRRSSRRWGGSGNPRIRRCQLARDGATVPISKPNCDSQSLVRPSLVDDSLTKVGILSTIDEILRQSVRIIVRL
uniref:Uncharacterized protein n=1 Tax=Rhodopseudomonas palustris (strain BisA53) TaxID=316055 RepID=Q07K58_RHOP5